METHVITSGILFLCVFFATASALQLISKKTFLPYTVALLLAGFLFQFVTHAFHLESDIVLDPSVVYYLLLPLLLFEASMKIDIHQFKLQFWTITFMSTFGLLVSMFLIGIGLTYVLGMPFMVALLFGALISATDPIAVLALFKSLGGPKRLALLADGESMFNDATAVIAFRVVMGVAFITELGASQGMLGTIGTFVYMFFGSIIVGGILGLVASEFIKKTKNDPLVEASITITLALSSFILADHWLHLSGVITTVIAGIIFGNLGKTRISDGVKTFVNEIWDYISFIAISLVFFFAAYQLNVQVLWDQMDKLHAVIIIVLLARAISVYFSFFITNKLPLFKNEPDVPLSWQHILNWGGLRGVIPLVLVYTLPEGFPYKEELLSFTLATFVFTLLINGLTIRWLLVKLGLHLPKREEEIIQEEQDIYAIEQKRLSLRDLPQREFYRQLIQKVENSLTTLEENHKAHLLSIASLKELKDALLLQALEITRKKVLDLFQKGYITESIVLEYYAQLDLQQDALEYPEVSSGRGYKAGRLPNRQLFRQRLIFWNRLVRNFPILKKFIGIPEDDIVLERLMQLKAKILCVDETQDYLSRVSKIFFGNKEAIGVIKDLQREFKDRKDDYEKDLSDLKKNYEAIVKNYQQRILNVLVYS